MNLYIKNLLVIWAFYNVLLSYLAFLPHREALFIHWTNVSISFLLSAYCFLIYKRGGKPRIFFMLFGSFFLFHSLSFITLFFGTGAAFGTDQLAWMVYQYWIIIDDFLLGISLIFLVLRSIMFNYSEWKVFFLSFTIITLISFMFNFEFITEPSYILTVGSSDPLYWASIKVHFFWIAFVFIYWFTYLPKDRPHSQYINAIVFGFSLFVPLDLLHILSYMYNFHLQSNIGQYWNLGILVYFLTVLTLKLHSTSTQFGRWYEQILISDDTSFGRRYGVFDRIIHWLFFSEEEKK